MPRAVFSPRERSSEAARRISRRRVLVGAAVLTAAAATGSGCGSQETQHDEELMTQLDMAHRDSQMARAAAGAAGVFYAPLLNVVANERDAHAKALSKEISRVAGATTPPPSAPTATSAASPPPSRGDVIAALRESADSAAKLAANVSGYRAGLLGSIAASCATSAVVPLALKEPAQ
ncbi:MAG TPA: twin-arginine translocation signal domain-containing protein [Mycobacterium sp.]